MTLSPRAEHRRLYMADAPVAASLAGPAPAATGPLVTCTEEPGHARSLPAVAPIRTTRRTLMRPSVGRVHRRGKGGTRTADTSPGKREPDVNTRTWQTIRTLAGTGAIIASLAFAGGANAASNDIDHDGLTNGFEKFRSRTSTYRADTEQQRCRG